MAPEFIKVKAYRTATLLAALALSGCAALPAATPPATSQAPDMSAGQAPDADNGRTVGLAVGARLEVSLHQRAGYVRWSQPASSDTSVLKPLPPSGGSSGEGTTVTTFEALRKGSADLTATSPFACTPGAFCPAIAQTWRLTVKVG